MIIFKCKKDLGRMKGDYESIEEDMKKILAESLIYEILSVVEEIPEGKVASYGQIAALIGREKNARLVGKVLSEAGDYGDYPCHRVVKHAGRTAPGWHMQRASGRSRCYFQEKWIHRHAEM